MVALYRAKTEEEERNKLNNPKGVQGKELLSFLGVMDNTSLEEMKKAIKEACEKACPVTA